MTKQAITAFRRSLLAWYRQNRRDLPWRRTTDPYKIWISEIMLQQTRVETVIPYYERFLKKYPTVSALARAKETGVLKQWEGLGYYSRARNLMVAAREVVDRYDGRLPSSSQELRNLKGFGPYTSAAVASIAFQEPVSVVDGNVRRVVSRLFADDSLIEERAQSLLEPKSPADFNQAMMELGARICLPRTPQCSDCPVRQRCRAEKEGTTRQFPKKSAPVATPLVSLSCVVITSSDKLFVRRRAYAGLWGGLWEFPTVESEGRAPQLLVKEMHDAHGLRILPPQLVGKFQHVLSHRNLNVAIFKSSARSGSKARGGRWIATTGGSELPFSRLQQRVREIALGPGY